MPFPEFRRVALAFSFCGIALAMSAQATCLPIPYTRYVGNTTTDSQCTDDSIQSAIDHSDCPTTIYVTNQRSWNALHLDINSRNVAIVGTTSSCGVQTCQAGCTPPTTPVVTLSGAGHTGDSVIYIHGNSTVTLKYLEIRDGYNIRPGIRTFGGGIHFDGRGSLTLNTTSITHNTADNGGGVQLTGTGGAAVMRMQERTRVDSNTATSDGGGIRIDEDSYLSMIDAYSTLWLNEAVDGHGGGLQIIGPAEAAIGAPSSYGIGALYGNQAQYGGAISVQAGAGDPGEAVLRLFATDAQSPVRLQGNYASEAGGAVYLKPYSGSANGVHAAFMCADEFRIDENAAASGGALFADDDDSTLSGHVGSAINLNAEACQSALPPSAVDCSPGVPCNTVYDNATLDTLGNPAPGAIILTQSASTLRANRVDLRDNTGQELIRLNAPNAQFSVLNNSLLAENALAGSVLRVDSGQFKIDSTTFVANAIGATATIQAGGPLILANTIIDQPGKLAVDTSSSLEAHYVLSTDVSTLPAGEGIALGRPTYIDPALGNYRLALNSLGVDFAPPLAGDDRDLDKLPHDQDLAEIDDLYGDRDLGAYERQPGCAGTDTIFCNGFESP